MEGQLLNYLKLVLEYNMQEKASLVDEFIAKCKY
jgi:hypothetical protein